MTAESGDPPGAVRSVLSWHRLLPGDHDWVVRDTLTVEDRGTGAGAEAIGDLDPGPVALGVEPYSAADISGADAASGGAGGALDVELSPTDHPSWVTVAHPYADAPEPWPRKAVAHRVLHMSQRLLFDDPDAPPLVRAGAVAEGGAGLLLVGIGNSGKSLVAAHLVRAGMDLVTDDLLALYPGPGLAAAPARPIVVKPAGRPYLPRGVPEPEDDDEACFVTARTLGGRHVLAARPALVAILHRHHDSFDTVVEPTTPARAVEALCSANVNLDRDPQAALAAFGQVAASCPGVILRYHDSASGAAALLNLWRSRREVSTRPWKLLPRQAGPEGADAALAASVKAGTPRRHPAVVSAVFDDSALLYHVDRHLALELNADGARIWEALPALPGGGADEFVAELARLGFATLEQARL